MQPDQLEAAINWVQETKNITLTPDSSVLEPKTIHSALMDKFSESDNQSTYAFGYPHAFIHEGRLVQFNLDEWDQHISPRENKVYLGFNPSEKTTTLRILVADKYEMGESEGAMPGDEMPILVPTDDSNVTIITIEHSKLSSPIVSFFDRHTATLENRIGHDEQEPTNLTAWSEVVAALTEKMPGIIDFQQER